MVVKIFVLSLLISLLLMGVLRQKRSRSNQNERLLAAYKWEP